MPSKEYYAKNREKYLKAAKLQRLTPEFKALKKNIEKVKKVKKLQKNTIKNIKKKIQMFVEKVNGKRVELYVIMIPFMIFI